MIRRKITVFFSLFCVLSFTYFSARATGDANNHSEKKFDAGQMILHHIGDAHDWHLFDIGEHPVSIPLPVIIYDKAKGISVFSSSKFEHGHAIYNGYKLEHEHIVAVNEQGEKDEATTANIYDFSITKNVAAMLISMAILLYLFISIAKRYKEDSNRAPKGLQSFLEPVIVFIRDDVAKSAIGEKKYEKFMPFLLTVFFFIFLNNLMGLVPIFPGGTNLTGNISITMTLALFTFVITTINGNKHYWRHIFAMPGLPVGVLLILTPIEIMGMFLKPFVLMVRLFANITAGHIIALSFFSLIFIFGEIAPVAGYGVSVMSLAFTVFMSLLELLVAFLQAYVFTLLSAMYFGMATEEHHH